jgi:hypothetical protein
MSVKFSVPSEIQENFGQIPVHSRRCWLYLSGDSFKYIDKSKYRYRMAIMTEYCIGRDHVWIIDACTNLTWMTTRQKFPIWDAQLKAKVNYMDMEGAAI